MTRVSDEFISSVLADKELVLSVYPGATHEIVCCGGFPAEMEFGIKWKGNWLKNDPTIKYPPRPELAWISAAMYIRNNPPKIVSVANQTKIENFPEHPQYGRNYVGPQSEFDSLARNIKNRYTSAVYSLDGTVIATKTAPLDN